MPRGQNPKSLEALKQGRQKTQWSSENRESAVIAGKKSQEAQKRKRQAILTFSETAGKRISQRKKNQIVDACAAYAMKGSLPHLEMLLKLLGEQEAEKTSDNRVEYVYPEGDDDLNG